MTQATPSSSQSAAKTALEAWRRSNPDLSTEQHVARAVQRALGYGMAGIALSYTGSVLALPVAACALVFCVGNAISAYNVHNEQCKKHNTI